MHCLTEETVCFSAFSSLVISHLPGWYLSQDNFLVNNSFLGIDYIRKNLPGSQKAEMQIWPSKDTSVLR